ncbi:DDE family endonuclease, partial [Rhizoctonia solani 123E]
IGCVGSNLRIVDYCVGYTGSAHDALAFRTTAAYCHPESVFQGDEFAWTDSAYPLSYRIIPVHKAPANQDPVIRAFDKAVSHLRVRLEHCNGMLKGLWQSLRGLQISIKPLSRSYCCNGMGLGMHHTP